MLSTRNEGCGLQVRAGQISCSKKMARSNSHNEAGRSEDICWCPERILKK